MWRTSRQACLLCPWARHLTGCLRLYVADRWWGQAVYPSWWPSLTKDMQTEHELIRVNESNFSWCHLRPHSFLFKACIFAEGLVFSTSQGFTLYLCFIMGPLSLLYKSFLRSLLTYASPGWFLFISSTNFIKLERLHRAASRAITGCLSSSPIPLASLLSPTSHPDSFHSFTL